MFWINNGEVIASAVDYVKFKANGSVVYTMAGWTGEAKPNEIYKTLEEAIAAVK